MGTITKPPCGNIEPHEPHPNELYPRAGSWPDCAGCGGRESSALKLVGELERAAVAPPHELTLYCHPTVRRALLNQWVPSYAEFVAQPEWDGRVFFGIPLIETVGADRDSWRLTDGVAGRTLIAEGVLAG